MQSKEAIARVEVIDVSDIVLLYAQISEMKIQKTIDSVIKPHGNLGIKAFEFIIRVNRTG